MFATDQRRVAEIAASTPGGLADVAKFALLSAQCPFAQMDKVMQSVNQRRWDGIPNLTATKRLGCEYIDANASRLWELTREWRRDAARSAGSAFMEWLKVPGLGLVKAGFAVQLTIGEVGCLDTHNIQRLGLRKADMQVNKARLANLATQASRYMVECKRQGGAEKLWDSWCCYVAKGQPKQWANAQAVSEWHWRVLDQQPF